MGKFLTAAMLAGGLLLLASPSHAAPKSTASQVGAETESASLSARRRYRHRGRVVRVHREPRHVQTRFKYYYGPGYRLYWGSAHFDGPGRLMWPYQTGPYPHTVFGFGTPSQE